MNPQRQPITVLMADDDPDDCMLLEDAWRENKLANPLQFVPDGEALMDCLHHRGSYESAEEFPLPGLILLDLHMPRKDGREALGEIKSDQRLKRIPVVVLTTSKAEEDILRSYNLGVSGFITKPVTFEGLVNVVRALSDYWFEIVELPPAAEGEPNG